jgi:hypothetical protein
VRSSVVTSNGLDRNHYYAKLINTAHPVADGYAAGWKSEAPSAASITGSILSAEVGTHNAHSPSPKMGYPQAGQIAKELPSGEELIATAVPFAR